MKIVKGETRELILQKNSMFDFVLNTPLSLVANEVWFDEEPISLIGMKNQYKFKALLNGTDVVNVKQWAKM